MIKQTKTYLDHVTKQLKSHMNSEPDNIYPEFLILISNNNIDFDRLPKKIQIVATKYDY